VGAHDVVLIDSGPADLTGNFPLYFPELVEQIDRTLRTIPDRAHRAVTGHGAGGFLAMWEAARSPDLVSSASSLLADREAEAVPTDFPVLSMDDLHPTPVKTWTINGSVDLAAVLDFHLKAFADPLPKPEVFAQADPYPNFGIWNWEVTSPEESGVHGAGGRVARGLSERSARVDAVRSAGSGREGEHHLGAAVSAEYAADGDVHSRGGRQGAARVAARGCTGAVDVRAGWR
jgi:hypothetical protein